MHTPEDSCTQFTFHYINGQSESFNVFEPQEEDHTAQGLQLEIRRFLEKNWWILNLAEQTVMINADNVVKVEVRPGMAQLHGEGVFSNAERVTALNRGR